VHRLVLCAVAIFVLLLQACSPAEHEASLESDEISAETVIKTVIDFVYLANPEAKGIVIHVKTADFSFGHAAGFANISDSTQLTPDHPVVIASITKTYVSSAILRLAELNQLTLEESIGNYLTDATRELMISSGFNVDEIQIEHLLLHISGIPDYAESEKFLTMVSNESSHRWTRDEQLQLTFESQKLGEAGETFYYSDANYLLLTEILEGVMNKPFYIGMRELLDYKANQLHSTWFISLEQKPSNVKEMAIQYYSSFGMNTGILDASFDLYGGGGIACTMEDLAKFQFALFHSSIFEDEETLDRMLSVVPSEDTMSSNYGLGISISELNGKKAYGHGGFWGSVVQYVPSIDASIAITVLEKDQGNLRQVILEEVVKGLE